MSSEAFLKSVLAGFASAFDPLRQAVTSPAALNQFLAEFGWALSPSDLGAVTGSLAGLPASSGDPSNQSAGQLATELIGASTAVRKIAQSGAPSAFASTFPTELLDYLVYFALARQSPPVFSLLHFVGVLTEQKMPADPATNRAEFVLREVHWDRLGGLADDPLQTIKGTYGWGTNFDGDGFIRSLGVLIRGFGGNASLQRADPALIAQYYSPATQGVRGTQNLIVSPPSLAGSATSGSVTSNGRLAFLTIPIPASPSTAGPEDGLALMPVITGQASDTFPIGDNVSLKIAGDMLARPVRAELHPGQSIVRATPGDAHVDATARLDAKAPAGSPWIALGAADSSRLEVAVTHASLGFSGQLDGDLDLAIEVGVDTGTLVIDLGDSDAFVQNTAGAGQSSAPFAFTLKWSSKSGFSISGSPNLSVTIPLQLSLGAVKIQSITVALGRATDGNGVTLDGTAALSVSIGPVGATISGVGFRVAVESADGSSPGNLGNADFSFGFKTPDGVGLVIDAAGVSGGGFLKHDSATHEYSGVLQLEFNDLALQAFGLITTQVAGRAGYSLLALIDADFPPVQLGWGFTLDGVGGLVGVNRSASTDALHAALKANTLSSILFPKNAITNAPQVLATLDAIFPTAAGRFVFGPMALIGWGTPTVLTAAIAIVVELPEPIRIILIARLSVRLPSESEALVRINLDALGILDFSRDSLSLDATLFDSKLLDYTLSGDMALRANWSSSQREFLLAIGGFHPQFAPPAGFPSLKRITIDMPSGPVSKLRLAAYLAVTSNTVQFGATLDVFIGVSEFGLSGHLGFDAILQLAPFHFDADVSGQVALTAGGDDLMSVGLEATLSGPAPWNIAGDFKVHIVFFDVHKSFSHSWGDDAPAQPIAPVEVLPLLTAALADSRNWGAGLPPGSSALVSLRSSDSTATYVHPLSRLEVHESVVPLGLSITRFGAAPTVGASSFAITSYQVNGSAPPHETIQDDFAPAQFFDLSDDEKLARPSFEPHDAGVRLSGKLVSSGAPISKAISYETFYVDLPGAALRTDPVPAPKTFNLADLSLILAIGASGRAAIRSAGNRRYAAPGAPVEIAPQSFVIADRTSLAPAGIGTSTGTTYSDARASLNVALAQNPSKRAALQIVASHEIIGA